MEQVYVIDDTVNNGTETGNDGIETRLVGAGCGLVCLGLFCANGVFC